MAKTLYIGGHVASSEMKVIFSERDFINLVEEYMGRDARNYINSIVVERDNAIKERNEAIGAGGYDSEYQDGFAAGLAAALEEYENGS